MHKSKIQSKNPSFSSTLLDEIYNSIDVKNPTTQHLYFPDNINQKQSTRTRSVPERKIHRDRFFGSVSSSSDSNSSIFSSSDTELTHGKKASSRPLCFGPSRTKPRKTEGKALSCENRAYRVFEGYDYNSDTSKFTSHEDIWEKQRSRSVKNSGNLKKPSTPVSPGGRIVSFLNSLFSNSRKTMAAKHNSRNTSYDDDGFARKRHDYPSTCSSASSFSRSCLNKSSEKSSDGVKRSVRFSPVNFIVSENSSSRSFVRKTSDEEEIPDSNRNGTRYMSSSLPDEWNMRKPQKKNTEDGGRRSVEEIARDFLREYHKNQTKSTINNTTHNVLDGYDDDEDDASDSSSDLFELDLIGNQHDRYRDELPVYETTFAGLIL